MSVRYHLYRGDVLLGTLSDLRPEFPWVVGSFEPAETFETARSLFQRSAELLGSRRYDEWNALWDQIAAPGLRIDPLDPADPPFEEFSVVHIRGNRIDIR